MMRIPYSLYVDPSSRRSKKFDSEDFLEMKKILSSPLLRDAFEEIGKENNLLQKMLQMEEERLRYGR